ncbi:MAG: ATP-binding protein, partial [Cyanobacteria bacterium P01_H01_bin.130]
RSPPQLPQPFQPPAINGEFDGEEETATAWFGVTDTGEGITADNLPHVFERFWRGDISRDRQGLSQPSQGRTSGAGIGLAITQQLVERHHGELVVISEPGQGSTFYFSLPLASPPAS